GRLRSFGRQSRARDGRREAHAGPRPPRPARCTGNLLPQVPRPQKALVGAQMPRSLAVLISSALVVVLLSPASHAQAPGVRGFPADTASAQRAREEQFRKVPSSDALKEYMSAMAAEPHVAGRPGSRKVAEYAL